MGAVVAAGGMFAGDCVSLAVARAGDGITAGGAGVSRAAVTGAGGLFAEDEVSLAEVMLTGGFVGCSVPLAATAGDVLGTARDGMTDGGAGVCLAAVTGAGSLFVGGEVSLVVVTLAAGVVEWGVPLAANAGNSFGTSTGCNAPAWTDTRTLGFTAFPCFRAEMPLRRPRWAVLSGVVALRSRTMVEESTTTSSFCPGKASTIFN